MQDPRGCAGSGVIGYGDTQNHMRPRRPIIHSSRPTGARSRCGVKEVAEVLGTSNGLVLQPRHVDHPKIGVLPGPCRANLEPSSTVPKQITEGVVVDFEGSCFQRDVPLVQQTLHCHPGHPLIQRAPHQRVSLTGAGLPVRKNCTLEAAACRVYQRAQLREDVSVATALTEHCVKGKIGGLAGLLLLYMDLCRANCHSRSRAALTRRSYATQHAHGPPQLLDLIPGLRQQSLEAGDLRALACHRVLMGGHDLSQSAAFFVLTRSVLLPFLALAKLLLQLCNLDLVLLPSSHRHLQRGLRSQLLLRHTRHSAGLLLRLQLGFSQGLAYGLQLRPTSGTVSSCCLMEALQLLLVSGQPAAVILNLLQCSFCALQGF
mmetsp:Transcript_84857/g.226856  ORF Transcript_84857/g.226856 Transcript_84857/m.226856 type:complete len:374 (+) Transcript_84857:585-1706(+)